MIVFFRKKENSQRRLPKFVPRVLVVLVVLVIIFAYPAFRIYSFYRQTAAAARIAVNAVRSQDIDALAAQIEPIRQNLTRTRNNLRFFVFVKPVPFLGSYYNDGQHLINAGFEALDATQILVDTLKPHADELGLRGTNQAQLEAGKRLPILVKVLEKLIPELDKFSPKLAKMREEVDQISPSRYPQIGPIRLKSQIKTAKDLIDSADQVISKSRPALEVLPQVLGSPSPKTYLVLFQNDKELRPSGGFLTAYTYITIDKGNLTTTGSDDIYSLDERIDKICLKKICNLTPPTAIVKYLPEPTGKPKQAIESRDSNISPDWQVAAREFERFYAIAGGKAIDGIIAVDTELVRSLLAVIGEIKVAGYQTEFNKDNIVNELLGYANVVFAGQPGRKAFLGDVMNTIFQTILQSPKEKLFSIGEVLVRSLNEKHVLLYLHEPKAQVAAESFNWAGRVKDYDGDYLLIVDSNFAGGKSNLFIEEVVSQKIEVVSDGTITKTVSILYKNPEKYHQRLNPGYRDWMRIFVPKGSQLVSAEGSQTQVVASEDLGKTVFEAFHTVRPEGSSRLTFKYTLPFKAKKGAQYSLLIQKQPGTPGFEYNVETNSKKVEKGFKLTIDKELQFKI